MKLLLSILCVGTWIFLTPVHSRALNRFKRGEIYSANETDASNESTTTETKEPDVSVSSTTVKSQPSITLSEVKESTPKDELKETDDSTKKPEDVRIESSDKPEVRAETDEELERDVTTKPPSTELLITEGSKPKEEVTSPEKESSDPQISTASPAPSYAAGTSQEESEKSTTTENSRIELETESVKESTDNLLKKEGRSDKVETSTLSEQTTAVPVDIKEETEELPKEEDPKISSEEVESLTSAESDKKVEEKEESKEESTTVVLYRKGEDSLSERDATSLPPEEKNSDNTEGIEQTSASETKSPVKEEPTELPSSSTTIDKQDAGRSHEHSTEESIVLKSEPSSTGKPEEEIKVEDVTSASTATEESKTNPTTRVDVVRKRFIDWVDYVPRDFHV